MKENNLTKLNSLFDAISTVAEGRYVFLYDMRSHVTRWSTAAVGYFNLPSEYVVDGHLFWAELIHPDDKDDYNDEIEGLNSGRLSRHDKSYRVLTADGSYSVCTCRGTVIFDDDGKPEFFGGTIRNHKEVSFVDPVTGCRSLYGFFDDTKGIHAKRMPTLMIMVGLSSFSDVNTVYGYHTGNRVLQLISRKLRELFGDKCAIYRMDGTRFAVITTELTDEEAQARYEQLQTYMKKDFYVDDQRIALTVNGGAIRADRFDIASETFYSCLRFAYYDSKRNRCGNFVVFSDVVSADNRKMIEQVNVIRSSITEDCRGFYLCYQPIVDSETEELKGLEALIRWKNDEYGIVPPNKFIPVLEQDAMFPELGKWILKQAMTDGRLFLSLNPALTLNVNLSYTQLEEGGFVEELFELLEETRFPADHLCLEITERCRTLDTGMLKDMFNIFRQRGIKIAVDDFGTGFASLGFLRAVPVDVVKIDREFVKDINKNTADLQSVKFISDLADAFSADVCAEGIEDTATRDTLKEFKIGSLQGYYYSKPVTADKIVEKLKVDA